MNPDHNYRRNLVTILAGSLIIMIALLVIAVQTMKSDYFNAIGRRSMTLAMVVADNLEISDEQVASLVDMDFNDLISGDYNRTFENSVRPYMSASEVKYIYILHQQPNMSKYTVETGEEDYYDLPSSTPLSTIYLLDAVINDQTRISDTDNQGYSDKDRYTHLNDTIQTIYNDERIDYQFYSDEWGNYISGFAPIYSSEGTYIGLVGADIYVDEYLNLIGKRIFILLLFCLLIIVMMGILFMSYKKLSKIEVTMEALRSRAYSDPMTGFYNRRTLKEQYRKYSQLIFEQSDVIASIMIDVDHFKRFNDTYGHSKGDEVISCVSNIIRGNLNSNQYPFRYGGDEFMIIAADMSEAELLEFSQTILDSVRSLEIETVDEQITLSIGIAYTMPKKHFKIHALINAADQMLYKAKHAGRDCVRIQEVATK